MSSVQAAFTLLVVLGAIVLAALGWDATGSVRARVRQRRRDRRYRVRITRPRLRGIEAMAAALGGMVWRWECQCDGLPNTARSHQDALAAACGHLKRGHQDGPGS